MGAGELLLIGIIICMTQVDDIMQRADTSGMPADQARFVRAMAYLLCYMMFGAFWLAYIVAWIALKVAGFFRWR